MVETWTPGQTQKDLPANAGEESIARLDKLRYADGQHSCAEIRSKMQATMQRHAAVFRR